MVQTNLNPQTYPTRYFKYQYCDNASTGVCTFKIATDFTNSNLRDTSFGWSIYYDQMMGTLPAVTTGFTACLLDIRTGVGSYYNPFTINEITEDEYDNSGYINWTADTMLEHIWNYVNPVFPNTVYAFGLGLPSFWKNDAGTYTGLNLFTDCAEFESVNTTYTILTGSSNNYGPCVTPTPTPTNTPTNTVGLSPTPTPTNTPTQGLSPTPTTTPTPTPTPSPTPVTPCDCYTIVNEGGGTGNYSWTGCDDGIYSANIGSGNTQKRCLKGGTTITINSGLLTDTYCATACTEDSDCTSCT